MAWSKIYNMIFYSKNQKILRIIKSAKFPRTSLCSFSDKTFKVLLNLHIWYARSHIKKIDKNLNLVFLEALLWKPLKCWLIKIFKNCMLYLLASTLDQVPVLANVANDLNCTTCFLIFTYLYLINEGYKQL